MGSPRPLSIGTSVQFARQLSHLRNSIPKLAARALLRAPAAILVLRERPTPKSPRRRALRHPCHHPFAYELLTSTSVQGRRDRVTVLDHRHGGVAERLKAAVLKTAGPKGLAGSNPASSANNFAG